MAQPRWTMVMARMVPKGLLIMVTVSIIFVVLLNSSMRISKNNFYYFGRIVLREHDMLDSIVPLGGPLFDFERNSTQSVIPNFTQPIIQNFTQFIAQNLTHPLIQNLTGMIWPLKATIKYGISSGLIMIVNASSESNIESIFVATSQHHATSNQWNINGALDGYMGELFAEVMDEVHNIEEAKDAIIEALTKCDCNNHLGATSRILYFK